MPTYSEFSKTARDNGARRTTRSLLAPANTLQVKHTGVEIGLDRAALLLPVG